jgi:hypothetical protein
MTLTFPKFKLKFNPLKTVRDFSFKATFNKTNLKRYWFKALRKSYPWSAVTVLALRLPATPAEKRSQLFTRIHRACMRQDFAEIGASIIDIQRPEYWIF